MNLNPIKANMTELILNDGTQVLFSYRTPVAAILTQFDDAFVKTKKFWSNTTSRHINKWFASRDNARPSTRPQEFFDSLILGVK